MKQGQDASAATKAFSTLAHLEKELTRISATALSVVGATFRHVESGSEVSINGEIFFPMASTAKIPVAVHILSMVDEGLLNLEQVISLKETDIYRPTWGPIGAFFSSGSVIALRDLIAVMLIDSDNNATDVLYRVGGGTAAVKARIRSYGLTNINNDRPINVYLANLFGNQRSTEADPLSPEEFLQVVPDGMNDDWGSWRGEEARAKLRQRETTETLDTATPTAMAALLAKIWKGEALRPASTKLLLDIMSRCITGSARLRGMLLRGDTVAHKTGTLLFTSNDVGIVDLPHGAGHLVAAVYVTDSYESAERRDALIAQLTRAAFDYFTFESMSGAM